MRRAPGLLAILLLHFCGVAAQVRSAGKSTIEGTVLRMGTDAPLFRATVQLISTKPELPSKPTPIATTDARGRFIFEEVDAGEYLLFFAINGYVAQQYGQRVFPGSGTPVKVVAGQTPDTLVVRLTPTGAVSGRVLDPNGRPLGNVPVQLVRQQFGFNGLDYSKRLEREQATRTNDRGEYRLFFVTPGRYLLSAGTAPDDRGYDEFFRNPAANAFRESVAYTFYPGVLEAGFARTLNVRSGEELFGNDIVVNPPRTYSIRGRVIDGRTGSPPVTVSVSLESRAGGSARRPVSYAATTGAFEFRDVPEGQYALVAGIAPAPAFTGREPVSPSAEAAGYVAINLAGSNLEGLVVTTGSGASLSGRVRAETAPVPVDLNQILVWLNPTADSIPATMNQMRLLPETKVDASGSFRFDHVWDATYNLSVLRLPEGWYVKQARLGDRNVLHLPLSIAGAPQEALDILLSSNVAEVQVTALDVNQKPVPGAQVVLVPAARDQTRLFSSETADTSGRVTLTNVVPGEYTLIAWEAIEALSWFDPEVVKDAEPFGKKLSVAEKGQATAEIRVIPNR